MYFPRLIDDYLNHWMSSDDHKPLLLRGARQVGKSSCIRHLGERFDYYIEANFENHPELKVLFEKERDVHVLAGQLGMMFNVPVVPGRTLIFLDEIQVSQAAIKSLWFFRENYPELQVVAAGSLLEFTLKELSSYGVGRIRSIHIYPMSFNEFLMAQGKTQWVTAKQQADSQHPLLGILHNELVQQFRMFMIVGGMPASVAKWVTTHNFSQCQDEMDDIISSYYDDFAKYAPQLKPELLRNTLQSVIMQQGGKFVYSRVEGAFRIDDVKLALSMLVHAGLIKRVSHTAANGLPLGAEVNDKFRKYIYIDSGLMLRLMDLDLGGGRDLTQTILAGAAADLVNKGGLTESILGWEMIKYSSPRLQHDLYYWENTTNGTRSEVDYVIARDLKVLPIECKAGTSGKMKSLWLFMKNKHLTLAYRCSLENFSSLQKTDSASGVTRTILINPLYAVANIMQQP